MISTKTLQVEVISEFGTDGWIKCHVAEIGDLLRRTFEQLVKQDVVYKTASLLEAGVTEFANVTVGKSAVIERCAEILGIGELPDKNGKAGKKLELIRREGISKIAGLTILNAMIFQDILYNADTRIEPLRKTLSAEDPIASFVNLWFYIFREINYQPIFGISGELLNTLPSSPETLKAVLSLGEKAVAVLASRTALRHDLMGRVYHTLLADKKYLATYYTSVPAATLLLKVALAPKLWNINWSNLEEFGSFRVADLACGTGTLLMAAYEALTDNYIHKCFKDKIEPDLEKSHRAIMEEIVYGYDVLPSALHLTASTLALRWSKVLFRRMHLYSLPLGEREHELRLGSIDFLQGDQISISADMFHSGSRQVTGTGDEKVDTSHPVAPLRELDLCVINPPFTRSVGGNLLFGSSPELERRKMQARLAKLLREKKVSASSTAGLGSVFVAVSDRALKVGGRLALVLPKTLLSGVAWRKTRDLLAKKYVVETIIVSHDPLKWNFSENTNLSEVLLVARKVGSNNPNTNNERVTCVNLWKNPETVFSTLTCARKISEESAPDIASGQGALDLEIGEKAFGEVVSIAWNEIRNELWMLPFAFAQNELVRVAYHSSNGKCFQPGYGLTGSFPVISLSCLGNIGPDARDIHDGFRIAPRKTLYPAYWDHNAEQCVSISQTENKYLAPLPKAKKGRPLRSATDLWPKSGRVLISERIWLHTQKLMALKINENVLSNVWWPLSIEGENELFEKSLVLWLNCTIGIITLLANRCETRGAWIKFKKPNLYSMPVLDMRALTDDQLKILSDAFDEVANEPLRPFPEMSEDPVRAKIDAAVSKALGLPDLSGIRMLLAQEPVVCLRPLYKE